jgi:hypothetical protein
MWVRRATAYYAPRRRLVRCWQPPSSRVDDPSPTPVLLIAVVLFGSSISSA